MKQTVAVLVAALALGSLARAGAAHDVEEVGGEFLRYYSTIYEALVADSSAKVAETAAKVVAEARSYADHSDDKAIYDSLAAAAEKVKGEDLEALREQFKGLSVAMDGFLREAETKGWSLYYCPMADGYWIQTAEGVRNPYYGASMLRCGDKVPGVGKG
jgi:hypothetical protein